MKLLKLPIGLNNFKIAQYVFVHEPIKALLGLLRHTNSFKVSHNAKSFKTIVSTKEFFGFKTIANFWPGGRVKNCTPHIIGKVNATYSGWFTFRHSWYGRRNRRHYATGTAMFSAIHMLRYIRKVAKIKNMNEFSFLLVLIWLDILFSLFLDGISNF